MKKLLFILVVCCSLNGFGQVVPSDTIPNFMISEMVSGTNWHKKSMIFDSDGNRIWTSKKGDSCCVVLINYKDTLFPPEFPDGAFDHEEMRPVLSRIAIDTILLSTYKKKEDCWIQKDYSPDGGLLSSSLVIRYEKGKLRREDMYDEFGDIFRVLYYYPIMNKK